MVPINYSYDNPYTAKAFDHQRDTFIKKYQYLKNTPRIQVAGTMFPKCGFLSTLRCNHPSYYLRILSIMDPFINAIARNMFLYVLMSLS